MILAVWQAAAFNIIIYLAGLQTVPIEVYEAALIDGAAGGGGSATSRSR